MDFPELCLGFLELLLPQIGISFKDPHLHSTLLVCNWSQQGSQNGIFGHVFNKSSTILSLKVCRV